MTTGLLPTSDTHNNFTQIHFIRKIETVREKSDRIWYLGWSTKAGTKLWISGTIFSNVAVDSDFFSEWVPTFSNCPNCWSDTATSMCGGSESHCRSLPHHTPSRHDSLQEQHSVCTKAQLSAAGVEPTNTASIAGGKCSEPECNEMEVTDELL